MTDFLDEKRREITDRLNERTERRSRDDDNKARRLRAYRAPRTMIAAGESKDEEHSGQGSCLIENHSR